MKGIGRHKLKLNIIFLMIAIGILSHISLDYFFGESITILAPFSNFKLGIDLLMYFPEKLRLLVMPSLDAALLIIWLIYLELKHKISDFI